MKSYFYSSCTKYCLNLPIFSRVRYFQTINIIYVYIGIQNCWYLNAEVKYYHRWWVHFPDCLYYCKRSISSRRIQTMIEDKVCVHPKKIHVRYCISNSFVLNTRLRRHSTNRFIRHYFRHCFALHPSYILNPAHRSYLTVACDGGLPHTGPTLKSLMYKTLKVALFNVPSRILYEPHSLDSSRV